MYSFPLCLDIACKTFLKEKFTNTVLIKFFGVNPIKTHKVDSFFFFFDFCISFILHYECLFNYSFYSIFWFSFFYRNAFSNKLQFRNIPFLKILIICLCWSWTCCALPQLVSSSIFNWNITFIIFIYVFAITIPFDIRDMTIDNKKIYTIPQFTGSKVAFTISQLSILFLFFFAFYHSNYLLCFFMIVTNIVLIPSLKIKSEFYYLFVLDGLLVIFPIFIL